MSKSELFELIPANTAKYFEENETEIMNKIYPDGENTSMTTNIRCQFHAGIEIGAIVAIQTLLDAGLISLGQD